MGVPKVYQEVIEAHIDEHPSAIKGCQTCKAIGAVGAYQLEQLRKVQEKAAAKLPPKAPYRRNR